MSERTRLPNRRAAQIAMFEHDGRRYRATFGTFSNAQLGEVFIDTGKPDANIQQHADASDDSGQPVAPSRHLAQGDPDTRSADQSASRSIFGSRGRRHEPRHATISNFRAAQLRTGRSCCGRRA